MDGIIIKESLKKKIITISLLSLFAFALFIFSVFSLSQGEVIFGFFGLIILGVVIYAVVRFLSRKDKSIYISAEGIKTVFPSLNKQIFIPWTEIKDFRLLVIKAHATKVKVLEFFLFNPEKFLGKSSTLSEGIKEGLTEFSYRAMNMNPQIIAQYGKPDVSLGDYYEKPLEEILEIIKQRHN